MEKIIRINLQNEDDLLEKYNKYIVNHKLINYIIKKSYYTEKNEKIKIIIYNDCNTNIHIKEKIIEGLKTEYDNTNIEFQRKNIIQLFLLLLGITFLFLSTLVNEEFIWKEILIISGWVPIWEMIDIQLFDNYKNRKTKKIIEKIIESEFIIE